MPILPIHGMTYPGMRGVMVVEGNHWIGVGYDEEGAKHIMIAEAPIREYGATVGEVEWYTFDKYPMYYGNTIWMLDQELRERFENRK